MDHSKSSQQENGLQTGTDSSSVVDNRMNRQQFEEPWNADADAGAYILPLGPYFQT